MFEKKLTQVYIIRKEKVKQHVREEIKIKTVECRENNPLFSMLPDQAGLNLEVIYEFCSFFSSHEEKFCPIIVKEIM